MATEMSGEAAIKDKGKSAKKRTSPLLFYRQVVAELRKVIWPTRNELVTYTTVSLIFVIIVVAIVFGLDNAFSWVVLKLFG
ncbi:preprotein translocase subunit SecE [Actinoallomurus sp. CA-150999]|uniref:preprotein translocase subunit SecE n=1 Tax=Actinoallomurus sp. CA-150999 TaxID=3239887 RepID=UPI003D8F1D29